MKPVRLVVLGALGRMGRAILDAIAAEPGVRLTGAVVQESKARQGATLSEHGYRSWGNVPVRMTPEGVASRQDVIIDVTRPESVGKNITWAARARIPYVLAVTGYDEASAKKVRAAAKRIPIVVSPNLSVGVAVLDEIAWIAAALMPDSEIEIVETHHKHKKDAPSGTALALANAIVHSARNHQKVVYGRPKKGERQKDSITIHSVRGGDVVGEHRVFLFSDGERIELGHVATSRAIFARGALRAARFVVARKPGIYSMRDVLGLGKGNR